MAEQSVLRPEATRILHLGPGAFFRAHMAACTQETLSDDPSFGIAVVSLRSHATVDALGASDGLYTLGILQGGGMQVRRMGAIREALALARDRERVMEIACSRELSILSMTVTEKGYALDPATGRLDFDHADIRHDLDHPDEPRSVVGLIVAILRQRSLSGLDWPTVMSLDNLRENGRLLRAALVAFAGQNDPALAARMEQQLAAPCSMVDRITPAASENDLAAIAEKTGFADPAAVVCEPFSQWVIEDQFAGARPCWERHGAILTDDVAPYENAKLRLINAPHSALAWMGLLRGHETVAASMADPVIGAFVGKLLRDELAPVTDVPGGFDKNDHIDAVIERFANPAIRHKVAQICTDSSQKIAQRLVPALRRHLDEGRLPQLVCRAIAAWIMVWQRSLASADPMAAELAAAVCGDVQETARAFLALRPVFGDVVGTDPRVLSAVGDELEQL
ncbi:MAG: mannitol dehydrogenase family protein [Geminicoccaceae bacterium]